MVNRLQWRIRKAESSDLDLVTTLLHNQKLPIEDLGQHLAQFLLAFEGENLAGCVGMELYPPLGLFRSLAVAECYQGEGLGGLLASEMLRHARTKSVEDVYLLTTTASGFFPRLGFKIISREQAPSPIARTTSFRDLCPASATLMHLTIAGGEA